MKETEVKNKKLISKTKKYKDNRKTANKGITLIALVVTIIVLLILAAVSITAVFGNNGLLQLAKEATDKTNEAVGKEQEKMTNVSNILGEYTGGVTVTTPQIPEGLKVGSTVTYSPSGTYNWQAKYCSSIKKETEEDVLLNSATGENFNISSWKVLSIDEKTGDVELVPSSPTTGEVYLGEAQGYNNGVKLLNDVCSVLYGNTAHGIEARSINIEDIEKYMTDDAIKEVHASPPYNSKKNNAYDKTNSYYPAIYALENKSVINGQEKPNGLGLNSQEKLIERNETIEEPINATEKEDKVAEDGKIQATNNIQPYETSWFRYDSDRKSTFKDEYYALLIPDEINATYWVASRCIFSSSQSCNFYIRAVKSGVVSANPMFYSTELFQNEDSSCALFPVVTLNSKLIKSTETNGFSVSLD